MLRLWLTRRWIVATVIAIGFGVACFFLGSWQWHRHLEQRTKVAAIEHNYGAAPVPVSDVLTGAELPPERQWTHVRVRGSYAADGDLLVRNRTLDSAVGFEVLTPFDTEDGTVLVDRGWVPNARSAATMPEVDPPPRGPVEIIGWLRTGEPSLGRDLPAGQLASISVADARAQRPLLASRDVYVTLGSQSPAAPTSGHPVQPLPQPDEGLGPHQAYAYQWWLTMPGGLVFVIWAMRRELAHGDERGPLEPATPRPRKVRIWDEEDA
ncbi:MAG TPA: SURF1 family protein [Intrasporangium sp.]|uniref:SURF1 family cytochrome oxidase biogenesis protein n=1 Tax=Intrasporangium sp. TaxID=1925024 RepID=UPI002D77D56D|nr:SURF1 family protein [Intrasporangium sp.]HET7398076.1 SURF1 family protein [Intrasporangium sp.]